MWRHLRTKLCVNMKICDVGLKWHHCFIVAIINVPPLVWLTLCLIQFQEKSSWEEEYRNGGLLKNAGRRNKLEEDPLQGNLPFLHPFSFPSFTHSLSLAHAHTLTHAHTLMLIHYIILLHTNTILAHTLSLTNMRTHPFTHTPSLSHSHIDEYKKSHFL